MLIEKNTSPLLNLAIIDQLHLLQLQFERVFIPPAVVDELRLDTQLPGVERIRSALEAGWLVVHELNNQYLVRALERDLDLGESQAIALALQLEFSDVLMDEHDGRAAAKALGLSPVGVLGILLRAKELTQVAEIQPLMQALQQDAGFYIADGLFAKMLAVAGEG